jgi:hypothetical protein
MLQCVAVVCCLYYIRRVGYHLYVCVVYLFLTNNFFEPAAHSLEFSVDIVPLEAIPSAHSITY